MGLRPLSSYSIAENSILMMGFYFPIFPLAIRPDNQKTGWFIWKHFAGGQNMFQSKNLKNLSSF